MDFLDPRKKRAHRRRLMVGYVLLAVAIMLGTVILVYGAYGYSLNTKTGDVIENGLLFVDSKPGGAKISLNGKSLGETTSARKVLQAGNYRLVLSKDGYRNWSRNFVLEEHSIARYVYPLLFPKNPVSNVLKKYTVQPNLITSSPDRHWVLVFSSEGQTETIDQLDTENLKSPPQALALPAGLITSPAAGSSYKLVEWSDDNKHVLVQRTYSGGTEFLVIDRAAPANSYNVNKLFNLVPDKVALRDKKFDQLYLHTPDAQLRQANMVNAQALIILNNVADFKAYGADLLLYVLKPIAGVQTTEARVWENTKTYALAKLPVGGVYLLDLAEFQGHFYYFAGSSSGSNISLFKDPLNALKDSRVGKALPFFTLRLSGAQKAGFSSNARFIEAQSGQSFAVYDLEESQYYKYVLKVPLASPAVWMDGHRLIGSSAGSVFVMDYDKTNQQSLVSSVWPEGGLFDRDYNNMFTLTATSGGVNLVDVDMRAGADLPADKR